MTLKDNLKIKRYLTIYKIQDLQFIILLKYIIPKFLTTTTFVLLKNVDDKNFLIKSSKQLYNYTKS